MRIHLKDELSSSFLLLQRLFSFSYPYIIDYAFTIGRPMFNRPHSWFLVKDCSLSY